MTGQGLHLQVQAVLPETETGRSGILRTQDLTLVPVSVVAELPEAVAVCPLLEGSLPLAHPSAGEIKGCRALTDSALFFFIVIVIFSMLPAYLSPVVLPLHISQGKFLMCVLLPGLLQGYSFACPKWQESTLHIYIQCKTGLLEIIFQVFSDPY